MSDWTQALYWLYLAVVIGCSLAVTVYYGKRVQRWWRNHTVTGAREELDRIEQELAKSDPTWRERSLRYRRMQEYFRD
jgi:hypothetical protein